MNRAVVGAGSTYTPELVDGLRLPARARPVVLRHPPVLGAALAALDAAGASDAAKARLREEFRAG